MNARTRVITAWSGVAVLVVVVAWLVATLPLVEGLGSKVKLPIFHGGSTWVSLVTFTAMGLLALVYIVTRRARVYEWESGLRWVSVGLWVLNTVLGLVAALNTWDFTGSQTSPLRVAMQDPRLTAQFWVLVAAGVLVVVQLLFDNRLYKAIADAAFTAFMWALLAPIFLDPAKRALHPDSPVLNSGWDIKLPFFGIVAGILGIALLLSWLIAGRVARTHVEPDPDAGDASV